jgi:membrane protein
VTLIGAVIAAALPIVKYERWWHVPTPGSAFEDAIKILQVLFFARHSTSNAIVNAGRIRAQTRFGLDEIEGLLQRMLEAGWVAQVSSPTAHPLQLYGRVTAMAVIYGRWQPILLY